ncbi:MAG: dihydroorotase [Oscillospiraceae bacterium]|nr:dihydroorotase [Oscillospiraceae bacterium]
MFSVILLRSARVIDPDSGLDGVFDILIRDGKIAEIGEALSADGARIIDAHGLCAVPGLVDMHVHLRDPGYTYKEDIASGTAAAARGGVTSVACMPNTKPVIDSAEALRYIAGAAEHAPVRVFPYGAVSLGQSGNALTDFAALKAAGAVALSDDGNPVMSAQLMRRALVAARESGLVISSHCEDAEMVRNYAVNDGAVSLKLGLNGRPAIAEELMVARDAMLAQETGARVHIAHVSTARSVEIIRRAKADGVAITAETCPQYFTLTEDEVLAQGSLARVNPPLRTEADRLAIVAGLRDGTLDAIATDHAPHSVEEKSRPLEDAPSGMVGLETSLALTLTALYHTGLLALTDIIRLMAAAPARILGLDAGTLRVGAIADVVLFAPDETWTVEPSLFASKSRNTPFGGRQLRGKVKYTISRGKIAYADNENGGK